MSTQKNLDFLRYTRSQNPELTTIASES